MRITPINLPYFCKAPAVYKSMTVYLWMVWEWNALFNLHVIPRPMNSLARLFLLPILSYGLPHLLFPANHFLFSLSSPYLVPFHSSTGKCSMMLLNCSDSFSSSVPSFLPHTTRPNALSLYLPTSTTWAARPPPCRVASNPTRPPHLFRWVVVATSKASAGFSQPQCPLRQPPTASSAISSLQPPSPLVFRHVLLEELASRSIVQGGRQETPLEPSPLV